MPRQPTARSPEDVALDQIVAEDDDAINRLAEQSGPPPDTKRLSEHEEDETYAHEDRFVADNFDALSTQLMTQGLPKEILGRMLIFKVRPDWLDDYANPTQDAERADMLMKAARYPLRWGLFDDVLEPTARVEKAERLDKRYQRRMTALREQMGQVMVLPGQEEQG